MEVFDRENTSNRFVMFKNNPEDLRPWIAEHVGIIQGLSFAWYPLVLLVVKGLIPHFKDCDWRIRVKFKTTIGISAIIINASNEILLPIVCIHLH